MVPDVEVRHGVEVDCAHPATPAENEAVKAIDVYCIDGKTLGSTIVELLCAQDEYLQIVEACVGRCMLNDDREHAVLTSTVDLCCRRDINV
jgi:hypothetical protein